MINLAPSVLTFAIVARRCSLFAHQGILPPTPIFRCSTRVRPLGHPDYDAQRECGGKFINSVDISNSVVAANPHSKRPFGFVIQTVSDLTGVSNKRSKYFLAASNTQDRDRWMTSLQLSANHAENDDFYSSSFATVAPVRVAHGSIGSPVDGSSAGPAESPLDGVDGSNSVFDVDAAAGISNEAPPSNPKPFKHQESSKRMRWNPASKIRALVSKKKLRFQERGPSGHQYDLDLGYITERIIAMGYPSDGTEGLYRNKWEEVKMFMEDFHRQRYRLYNLCSEKAYPPQRFMNRVAVYPFNDHGVPPLSLVQLCCKDMVRWLDSDPLNVCAVHCKAGKGRTGLIVACFLLHTGVAASASEVLELYGTQRCADGNLFLPTFENVSAVFYYLLCVCLLAACGCGGRCSHTMLFPALLPGL